MMQFILLIFIVILPIMSTAAGNGSVPLEHARINLRDKASLQRGAKLYINYCLGCHSMAYLRYNRMAKDIGIKKADGSIALELLKNNLIFSDAKVSDPILSAMPAKEAATGFGVQPPDLTLAAKVRGPDWIYTYLKSFYVDPKRPLGVNNLVYPDVAMPNVLVALQGIQQPIYKEVVQVINGTPIKERVVDHLALVKVGTMSQHQFDSAINDLVNFLAYTARPETLHRQIIGIFVILFLLIFALITYLLKREYWRDVD